MYLRVYMYVYACMYVCVFAGVLVSVVTMPQSIAAVAGRVNVQHTWRVVATSCPPHKPCRGQAWRGPVGSRSGSHLLQCPLAGGCLLPWAPSGRGLSAAKGAL